MITDAERILLKLHNHYKQGHLLTAGGIMDQPNYYLDAMEQISAAEASGNA
jgi:hypothetical protein